MNRQQQAQRVREDWDELRRLVAMDPELSVYLSEVARLGVLLQPAGGEDGEEGVPSCVMLIRRLAECALKKLCRDHRVAWSKDSQRTPSIENLVGPLTANHVLPPGQAIHIRTIQCTSNLVAHDDSGRSFTTAHLRTAQTAMIDFLEWILSYPGTQEVGDAAGQVCTIGAEKTARNTYPEQA